MSEPLSAAGAGLAASKTVIGAKVWSAVAGISGAAIMIAVRPNLTRKQMFIHAAVAGVASFYVTNPLLAVLAQVWDAFDTTKWAADTKDDWKLMWAFVVGALSWGVVGGLYFIREKIGANPLQAIMDVRNAAKGDYKPADVGDLNIQPPVYHKQGNAGKFD